MGFRGQYQRSVWYLGGISEVSLVFRGQYQRSVWALMTKSEVSMGFKDKIRGRYGI